MKKVHREAKPSFFWQGLLLVLPVFVLAAFGLYSLRLDRQKAEQEAVEQARTVAENLAEAYEKELTNSVPADAVVFEMDPAGNLLNPRRYKALPEPHPLDISQLPPDSAVLWQAAGLSQSQTNWPETITSWRAFLASQPPPRFEANALYGLGMALKKQSLPAKSSPAQSIPTTLSDQPAPKTGGDYISMYTRKRHLSATELASEMTRGGNPGATVSKVVKSVPGPEPREACDCPEAAQAFKQITSRFPDELTESGVPLLPLAQIQWLETAGLKAEDRDEALRTLVTNIMAKPSFLTLQLIKTVAQLANEPAPSHRGKLLVQDLVSWWDKRQTVRVLHALLPRSGLGSPGTTAARKFFWMSDETYGERYTTLRDWPYLITSTRPSNMTWFAVATTVSNALQVVARPAAEPERLCPSAALLERTGLPAYGGLSFELASQPVGLDGKAYLFERRPEQPKAIKRPRPNVVNNQLQQLVLTNAPNLTAFPGVQVDSIWHASLQSAKRKVLASASRTENGLEFLRVNVHLANPELLYKQVQSRSLWLGLLIGTAALAAFMGWLAAWRAFHRQHQLAALKTNFVSSVSHELRAPIASVRLMAEGLERGKIQEPGKQREYFRFIVQECRRLSSLVENVLDFSRIEQGRKEYDFEPTDLKRLVEETVKLMGPSAEERQIRLKVVTPKDSVSADVDGRAIQQALVNLIDNAVKHSPENASVSIELDDRPDTVTLSVEDHGPGIPREEHERIFERFYRRGSELRRETQGVGIGLSIVKHIVEAHNGQVWVQSEPGKGSRFNIELPNTGDGEKG